MTKLPYGLSDFKRVLEEEEKNYTTNLKKINSILDKYKDVKFEYFEDFYGLLRRGDIKNRGNK